MKTSSAKNKGRRLQNWVRDRVLELFPSLTLRDVRSTPMGVTGSDVMLSEKAVQLFPFAVECKNTEKLSIWESLKQAETHEEKLIPLLFFKRNRSKEYVCLKADDFFKLITKDNKDVLS